MGILDGLRSRSDAINAQRVGRDNAIRKRAEQRPDWVPEDWPEGVPYVSLAAEYAGRTEESAQTDGVTVRTLDEAGRDVPLSDAQMDGWRAIADLERRRTVARELEDISRRTQT